MKMLAKIVAVCLVLGVGVAVAFPYLRAYWKARHKPSYRQAEVIRGEIISVVNSTGTVQPVLRVQVGSFVSGPIQELCVEHNDQVKEGQLLAKIDPRIYKANVARDQEMLASTNADLTRVEALLEQAVHDEQRAEALRQENEDYISDTEMDKFKYARIALEAQIEVAKASVAQAKANLSNSQEYLDYTQIKSPVDGIIIERKIDEGQTLTAQFQTPELFVVAPDMEKEMHVFASVDEADIGLIDRAKKESQKVQFTVDAYPDDLFEGTIYQIRKNPTTMQNVVTYPVVVSAPNPGEKLLPGMTASLSFQIDRRDDILKVPNAALRFYPKPEQVRPKDRALLEGADSDAQSDSQDAQAGRRSAAQTAKANKKRDRRHVWMIEGDFLKAIEIFVGLSDYKHTEVVSGKLKPGQKLVTGVGPPKS